MSNTTAESPPPPSSSEYFGPQEPSVLIWLENTSFAGNIMGAIFYGVVLTLFIQCVIAIVNNRKKPKIQTKKSIIMLCYVCFMFAMGTLFTAGNMNLQQRSYISFRNFPDGGPLGYGLSQYSTWRAIMPNAVFIISNWFADGLLQWVIILPMIMFGGSICKVLCLPATAPL
ncbi:hypothetical protein EV360DRAFT_58185 [Lentinula raphanica]|nr:hypothetical protein EV360DRAFT_58185 [Lentinula raphanica]